MRAQRLTAAARTIADTVLPRRHQLAERTGVIGDGPGPGAMLAIESAVLDEGLSVLESAVERASWAES